MKILTGKDIRRADLYTIEHGPVESLAIMERADSTMTDIRSVSAGLAEADIASLVENLDSLLVKVRGTEGTVGRLINEDSVYNSVDSLVSDLDRLVRKIEENPKKYIRISVF